MARRGENIYKRKDGRYEGRYIKGYDETGKAIYGYIYSKSYSEIKYLLAKCKAAPNRIVSGPDMKLSEWTEMWIKSRQNLKPTTLRVYQSYIKNHILPALGDFRLKKLNAHLLHIFINNLNLSPSSVRSIFTTLKSILEAAEDESLIYNTWKKIQLPQKRKSEVRILTCEEQRKLESVLDDSEDIGIWICLYTGLRIGEICALKWEDIDFKTGILSVNGTLCRTKSGLEIIKPKSEAADREIPLTDFLMNKLKAIRKRDDFVISKLGFPIDTRTYRRNFKSILKKAGLPDIKFHAIRHTFVTRALEAGMDFKTLSEILGHSSIVITLDLYAHSLTEHKKKEMYKLEKFLKP